LEAARTLQAQHRIREEGNIPPSLSAGIADQDTGYTGQLYQGFVCGIPWTLSSLVAGEIGGIAPVLAHDH
jgi:hypothetical protein